MKKAKPTEDISPCFGFEKNIAAIRISRARWCDSVVILIKLKFFLGKSPIGRVKQACTDVGKCGPAQKGIFRRPSARRRRTLR